MKRRMTMAGVSMKKAKAFIAAFDSVIAWVIGVSAWICIAYACRTYEIGFEKDGSVPGWPEALLVAAGIAFVCVIALAIVVVIGASFCDLLGKSVRDYTKRCSEFKTDDEALVDWVKKMCPSKVEEFKREVGIEGADEKQTG